jgi:dTDP-4-dehydrorhamnose 3,5-epimerase
VRVTATPIAGAHLIDPEPRADERGYFARLWSQTEFADKGLAEDFVQCNAAFNVGRATLRGLHYQVAPHQEVKLVRCVHGAIFDVLVDLRPDSPTYLRWFGKELTARNGTMLYVPHGCAHGYVTLEDRCEIFYLVSHPYHPEAERGARWNDPAFGIQWPIADGLIISAKDRGWPDYQPKP